MSLIQDKNICNFNSIIISIFIQSNSIQTLFLTQRCQYFYPKFLGVMKRQNNAEKQDKMSNVILYSNVREKV